MYGTVRSCGFPERRCGEDNTCHCRLPRIQLLICSSCLSLERGYSSISPWQKEWLSFLHTILILTWSTNYLLPVCLINLIIPLQTCTEIYYMVLGYRAVVDASACWREKVYNLFDIHYRMKSIEIRVDHSRTKATARACSRCYLC